MCVSRMGSAKVVVLPCRLEVHNRDRPLSSQMAAVHFFQKWSPPALEPRFAAVFIRNTVQKGESQWQCRWLKPKPLGHELASIVFFPDIGFCVIISSVVLEDLCVVRWATKLGVCLVLCTSNKIETFVFKVSLAGLSGYVSRACFFSGFVILCFPVDCLFSRPALPWRGSCSPRERTSLSSGISSDTTSVPNSWQERRKNLWFPFLLMKDLKRWGVMISPPGAAWRPAPPTSPCGVAPERSSYHCLWPLLTVAICWIPLYGSPPASGEPRQHQGNLAELPYETEQGLEPGITYRAPG